MRLGVVSVGAVGTVGSEGGAEGVGAVGLGGRGVGGGGDCSNSKHKLPSQNHKRTAFWALRPQDFP